MQTFLLCGDGRDRGIFDSVRNDNFWHRNNNAWDKVRHAGTGHDGAEK